MKLDFKTGLLVYSLITESIEAVEIQFSEKSGKEKLKECIDMVNAGINVVAYNISLPENIVAMIKANVPEMVENTFKLVNSMKAFFKK